MVNLQEKPYYLTELEVTAIQKLVQKMTTEEKIGQLFFVIGQDENMVNLTDFINTYKPGGVMYRPDNADKIKRQIATLQAASKVPLFIAANLEAGGNGLIHEGTWLGSQMEMAATNDSHSAYQLGKIAGYEAQQVGGNMAFAPIVDIDYNFKNPITNVRTFGSNPDKVLAMSQAQIKGFSENQVISCIKHFPGDGVDERDQHLLASVNSLSTDDWLASYGHIYKTLIEDGVSSIMIAHIFQPAWERKLQPAITDNQLRPASLSKTLIDGLLRGELGYNGLTITDATPMIGYHTSLPREEALVATINAGIDMILFNKNIDQDYAAIRSAVADGRISEQRLNQAVTRILATKLSQKIMDREGHFIDKTPHKLQLNTAEHRAVAASIAKKAVTLVKDRDQLLPLLPEKYKRIRLYILGDKDEGGFKEGGRVTELFKTELEEAGFEVTLFDREKLDFHEVFEEGVDELKTKLDLALYVANVETASNQTSTRLNWIQLMAADAPWFMKSIPTVFVSTANPYHLFDVPQISTFINAYTGKPETVHALVEKLTGKDDFTGVSPVDAFCGQFDTHL